MNGSPMSAPEADRLSGGEAQSQSSLDDRASRTVLFLDYDGVLHPNNVYLERRRPVLRTDGELFMWSAHLIEALESYPHIKIVLSTSWARVFGFERARNALAEPLRARVIGATWHSRMGKCRYSGMRLPINWWDEASRFEQILRYVERARLEHWVAVDDQGESWSPSYRDHLIVTDPGRGIADPQALSQLHARLAAL